MPFIVLVISHYLKVLNKEIKTLQQISINNVKESKANGNFKYLNN